MSWMNPGKIEKGEIDPFLGENLGCICKSLINSRFSIHQIPDYQCGHAPVI
jgi:hypothetical protein